MQELCARLSVGSLGLTAHTRDVFPRLVIRKLRLKVVDTHPGSHKLLRGKSWDLKHASVTT